MTTYPATFSLSEPSGDQRIPRSTLTYLQSRNRHRLYDLVIDTFAKSGLTQATLARRLGKGTDRVCRILGAPGNWELDTLSDLVFAIGGGEVEYGLGFPLSAPPRNMRKPEWADAPPIEVIETRERESDAEKRYNFFKIDIKASA